MFESINSISQFVLQALLLYLLADFFSGLIHWWEDRYISASTPFWGSFVGEPNERHHREPAHFLTNSYWRRIRVSSIGALIMGVALWTAGLHFWQPYFVLFLLSQANQIHAWGHQGRTKNGPLVYSLQSVGFLQSTKAHARHHKAPYDCNYCVLTDYLNPILHKMNLWKTLELMVSKGLKINPVK